MIIWALHSLYPAAFKVVGALHIEVYETPLPSRWTAGAALPPDINCFIQHGIQNLEEHDIKNEKLIIIGTAAAFEFAGIRPEAAGVRKITGLRARLPGRQITYII
jgi:hypothetical protein